MILLPNVKLNDVQQDFVRKIERLDDIHKVLFGFQLTVTATTEGKHSKGSKHYKGLAFDMRMWDKTDQEQLLWGVILAYFAKQMNLAVFDERARDASPHWHAEEAD